MVLARQVPESEWYPAGFFGACLSRSPKQNRSNICLACQQDKKNVQAYILRLDCLLYARATLYARLLCEPTLSLHSLVYSVNLRFTTVNSREYTNELDHEKMCFMSYANNKGADQPAHPRSLISAFVVRC